MQRPDIPLANTPEPQPVTSGLQPMAQSPAQPVTKYQATADAAIQQVSRLSKERMSELQQPQQPQTPMSPQQPQ
jgi:hypothetical protein